MTKVSDRFTHRLNAFGLDVASEWALPGANTTTGGGLPRTRIGLANTTEFDRAWSEPAEQIQHLSAGQANFVIDRSATHFRLQLRAYGRYLVSGDGSTISCESGGAPREAHERFLFAQALPLAAALHGYAMLHASAVGGSEGAVAFVGASGAGKTTIASQLVVRGKMFLTDDVLALQPGSEGPVVHPGPPFMALVPQDGDLVDDAAGRLGSVIGATDKLHVNPAVGGQMPLRALYHLRTGEELSITRSALSDLPALLGTGFAPYLMTPARLRRHLMVTQQIDTVVPQFRLEVPRRGSLERVLDTLQGHLQEWVG